MVAWTGIGCDKYQIYSSTTGAATGPIIINGAEGAFAKTNVMCFLY